MNLHFYDVLDRPNPEIEALIHLILEEAGSNGIPIDLPRWHRERRQLYAELLTLEQTLLKITNRPFNWNSRKEMAAYLFDECGLPPTRKRSVAQKNLRHLSHPVLKPWFRRQTVKRTLSLMDNALNHAHLHDGRLTTNWHTANETSGRIYCDDYNVQQLPIPARRALIADDGTTFLFFDYRQFELRVLAALSQDPDLLALVDAEDVHQATADRTGLTRTASKAVVYGLIFGQQAPGLAQTLGVEIHEAQDYLDAFFAQFPGVLRWIRQTQAQGVKDGFIENPLGHRRVLDDEKFQGPRGRGKLERTIVNTLVQGTAASLLKRVLIALHEVGFRVRATVHDSGLIELPSPSEDGYRSDASTAIEIAEFTWRGVKFPVDFAISTSWGDAQSSLKE